MKALINNKTGWSGTVGWILLSILLVPALYAPLVANGRPLVMVSVSGDWSFPWLRYFFAPDSHEALVEQLFNLLSVVIPLFWLLRLRRVPFRRWILVAVVAGLVCGFAATGRRVDKTDYRNLASSGTIRYVLFAPIPYGPYETVGKPHGTPCGDHWFGTDEIGRDVASRLIYGARVSLAVGVLSTLLALAVAVPVGLSCGFYGGRFDMVAMRIVEILLCFPTFLLLLILMSMSGDMKFDQSAPLLILVIGLTGWIGMAMLARGEVLRQRHLSYVEVGLVSGLSHARIMFRHLLPNSSGPLLISFAFGVAGGILAESSLSFLGFGVQPPTASWGELLRQAFDNPLEYWHLTLFPGLALFVATMAFNFIGEGLRKELDVRSE